MIDASIGENPGGDRGGESGADEVAIATTRAPQSFRHGSGVAIIVDADRWSIRFRYFGGQREVTPAWKIRRINHHACARIERAWSADPYTGDRTLNVRLEFRRGNDRVNGGDHRSQTSDRILGNHRHTHLMSDFAPRLHTARGHFRAANVHADEVLFCHSNQASVKMRAMRLHH